VYGEWNDWEKGYKLQKCGDDWVATVRMPPGRYQYKFIVDGTWVYDMSDLVERDENGNINNVREVKSLSEISVFNLGNTHYEEEAKGLHIKIFEENVEDSEDDSSSNEDIDNNDGEESEKEDAKVSLEELKKKEEKLQQAEVESQLKQESLRKREEQLQRQEEELIKENRKIQEVVAPQKAAMMAREKNIPTLGLQSLNPSLPIAALTPRGAGNPVVSSPRGVGYTSAPTPRSVSRVFFFVIRSICYLWVFCNNLGRVMP